MTELCACGSHRAMGACRELGVVSKKSGKHGCGGRAGVGGLAYGGGQGWKEEIDDVLSVHFSLAGISHAHCHGSSQLILLLFAVIVTHVLIQLGGR